MERTEYVPKRAQPALSVAWQHRSLQTNAGQARALSRMFSECGVTLADRQWATLMVKESPQEAADLRCRKKEKAPKVC